MLWGITSAVITGLVLLALAAVAFRVFYGRSPLDVARGFFREATRSVVLAGEGSASARVPVSGRRSIYYRLTVQERRSYNRGGGGQGSRWVDVADEKYGAPLRATTVDGQAVELPLSLEVRGAADWQRFTEDAFGGASCSFTTATEST